MLLGIPTWLPMLGFRRGSAADDAAENANAGVESRVFIVISSLNYFLCDILFLHGISS